MFKLLIPFLSGGAPAAGRQIKLSSVKHTSTPQTPPSLGGDCQPSAATNDVQETLHLYKDTKASDEWVLFKQQKVWRKELVERGM